MSVIERIKGIQILTSDAELDDHHQLGETKVVEPRSYLKSNDGWTVQVHWSRDVANLDINCQSTIEEVKEHLSLMLDDDVIVEEIFNKWMAFQREIPEGKAGIFVWRP
jgi:hypothetical protein